jgi:formate dehydrogenase iron-sulfur subunit
MTSQPQDFSLIDLLLSEQKDLTAVQRFAQLHEQNLIPSHNSYRDLVPFSKPAPGEQYAFVVDLDRCSGCKACVSACHSLNGLEEGESWRSVGLLLGERTTNISSPSELPHAETTPYIQTITTACHHCAEPACSHGCPVLAYEKDPATGIVRHLDDQCIGCQYCVLKCPYDVPKYSKKKGIVRKCDMCYSRLANNEAPACVQACPHQAIRIDIVSQGLVKASASLPGARLLPGAPDSSYTLPLTTYQTQKGIPLDAQSANHGHLALQSPHWPLILMLVFSQAAAGLHLLNVFFSFKISNPLSSILPKFAALLLLSSLSVSVLHLGRPLKAWKVFLGWRRSWMSREIIAFAGYSFFALLLLLVPGSALLSSFTASLALLSVFSSAMIYIDTRRQSWPANFVFLKFFGTLFLLGTTIGAAISAWFAPQYTLVLASLSTLIRTTLFFSEALNLWTSLHNPASPLHRSTLTAWHLARPLIFARIALFIFATAFALLAIFTPGSQFSALIACLGTIAAQIIERWLFFTTVSVSTMPGGVPA